MWNPFKPSAWDTILFDGVVVLAVILLFAMRFPPLLTKLFCGWLLLMAVLHIIGFVKKRRERMRNE